MVIFRWLSLVLIVMAVMLLGADLVGTLERKAIVIRSLYDMLVLFNYDAKPWLIATLPAQVVNGVVFVIESPGWLTLGFFAFFFTIIAPPSKPVRPLPPPPPIPR
jgi:hypothetical protein